MVDDAARIGRAAPRDPGRRPLVIAIAGDSAAGKATLAAGLVDVLGHRRCRSICLDDYLRYDRAERDALPFTALHPHAHHLDILDQHLRLLRGGEPVLKPVYDHATGRLARPELVEPADVVIVRGLLPLHSRRARACFDLTVYVDPPEHVRRAWKVARDARVRGHRPAQVHADLLRRELDAEAFVRPQRAHADVVVSFAPVAGRDDPPGTPLSAEIRQRPSLRRLELPALLGPPPPECDHDGRHGLPPAHGPDQVALAEALRCEQHAPGRALHLKAGHDGDGRPVEVLHVHGYVPAERSRAAQRVLWTALGEHGDVPPVLGRLGSQRRSEPLAITQLVLLHHLAELAR